MFYFVYESGLVFVVMVDEQVMYVVGVGCVWQVEFVFGIGVQDIGYQFVVFDEWFGIGCQVVVIEVGVVECVDQVWLFVDVQLFGKQVLVQCVFEEG